jgi:hypothetical protein
MRGGVFINEQRLRRRTVDQTPSRWSTHPRTSYRGMTEQCIKCPAELHRDALIVVFWTWWTWGTVTAFPIGHRGSLIAITTLPIRTVARAPWPAWTWLTAASTQSGTAGERVVLSNQSGRIYSLSAAFLLTNSPRESQLRSPKFCFWQADICDCGSVCHNEMRLIYISAGQTLEKRCISI